MANARNAPRNGPSLGLDTENRRQVVTETVGQQQNLVSEVGKTLLEPALDCAHASVRIRERMEKEDPAVRDEVEKILSGLFDPRPSYGEPVAADHPYLEYIETTKKDGTVVSTYRIKPGAVEASLESLALLQKRHPDLAGDFEAVKTSLHAYARRDDRMVVRDLYRSNRNRYTSQALGKMGGTVGFMVTSFAAAAFGTMAVINLLRGKGSLKDFMVPCFYGAIAAYLYKPNTKPSDGSVKPNVSDTIFDSKLTAALAPVDKALNKSGFTEIARAHGIEGKEWANIIESFMTADAARDTFLKEAKNGNVTKEGIDAHVQGVTGDPRIQESLRAMIANGRYEHLVRNFSGITQPESKEVIKTYVEWGAWKQAK